MKRGDLYRVKKPGSGDPRKHRIFVVVSRQMLIDSRYSTVICAPVYSRRDGLSTQVDVGIDGGLKHPSSVQCDALVSLPKTRLTDFVGRLDAERLAMLGIALARALAIDDRSLPVVGRIEL